MWHWRLNACADLTNFWKALRKTKEQQPNSSRSLFASAGPQAKPLLQQAAQRSLTAPPPDASALADAESVSRGRGQLIVRAPVGKSSHRRQHPSASGGSGAYFPVPAGAPLDFPSHVLVRESYKALSSEVPAGTDMQSSELLILVSAPVGLVPLLLQNFFTFLPLHAVAFAQVPAKGSSSQARAG